MPSEETSATKGDQDQENFSFLGDEVSQVNDIPSTFQDYRVDAQPNAPLGEYLSRPVLIKSFVWTEGASFDQAFEPWFEYFNNTHIKKKLDNFYLLRCNLHIKFVINASPFYYGAIMVSYRPLSSLATGTDFNPAPVLSGLGFTDVLLMGRSQRPHIFLYPQNSQGGEMKLPFFYPKDWMDATSADDFRNMGTINMDSMKAGLLNANSVSGGNVDIQVYAWTEDLELAAPTYDYSVQSQPQKDEYSHKGVISAPASAIAGMMNKLSILPVIAPFATATSMIASGISDLASLFGFTNVPVIDDVHAFKGQPFPHMATTQIGVPCEKLTLDSKNELSIDPKINGIDLGDEMMITNVACREYFVEAFNWTSSQVTNDLVMCSRVYPGMFLTTTSAGINYFQGSPAWMIMDMFKFWRGDVIYRFKILCTKFHRGRLRITWDPSFGIGTVSDTTTTNYNKVIDITKETDVEFCVPYTQPTSYLDITGTRSAVFMSDSNLSPASTNNGILTLRVLNTQTSPALSADIVVLCFVRPGKNFKVACPKPLAGDMTPYTIQSLGVAYDEPNCYDMALKPSQSSKNIDLIYMGENIVSLRQLMRRQNFSYSESFPTTTPDRYYNFTTLHPRMPLYYGYDPNGKNLATDTLGVSNSRFNYNNNTIINWINQCFVAHKGSIIWNINAYSQDNRGVYDFDITRQPTKTLSIGNYRNIKNTVLADEHIAYFNRANRSDQFGGLSLTNQRTQAGLNALVPMYSPFKFLPNDPNTRTLGTGAYETDTDNFQVSISKFTTGTNPETLNVIDFYCGIGTDFSSIFFLNVPTMRILSTVPLSPF